MLFCTSTFLVSSCIVQKKNFRENEPAYLNIRWSEIRIIQKFLTMKRSSHTKSWISAFRVIFSHSNTVSGTKSNISCDVVPKCVRPILSHSFFSTPASLVLIFLVPSMSFRFLLCVTIVNSVVSLSICWLRPFSGILFRGTSG